MLAYTRSPLESNHIAGSLLNTWHEKAELQHQIILLKVKAKYVCVCLQMQEVKSFESLAWQDA